MPYGKVALLARGLGAHRALRRRPPHAHAPEPRGLPRDRRRRRTTPRASSTTCAAIEGTAVAALVRDRLGVNEGTRKVSLRASDERVDVSAIARAQGGGGHRQAAGFSTTLSWDELVAFLRAQVAAQL